MSPRDADWERKIGRQLKLRDLHVLLAVAQHGSMAKAAAFLSVTQPAVSQAIADLERAVGVPLVDRGPRGVELTVYGKKLLTRTTEAFDSLKQGLRDIEFHSDPGSGEVCVGADMSYIAGGFVAAIIERVSERYPRLAVQVIETTTSMVTPEFRELRERKVDLVLGRISSPIVADDLRVEPLFDEAIVVATNTQNRWAGRSHVELAALREEAWILAPAPNMARELVESAFRRENVETPIPKVTTYSIHLRLQLLASGRYLTVITEATVRYGTARWSLTTLPVDLGPRLPVVAVTLKHRTLSPSAELFMREARAATKAMRSSGEVGC